MCAVLNPLKLEAQNRAPRLLDRARQVALEVLVVHPKASTMCSATPGCAGPSPEPEEAKNKEDDNDRSDQPDNTVHQFSPKLSRSLCVGTGWLNRNGRGAATKTEFYA